MINKILYYKIYKFIKKNFLTYIQTIVKTI